MLKELNKSGDVILFMDNDISKPELEKVLPYVLHADAIRHKEYDFGSYKRAYEYAQKRNLLSKYDFIYLVNDSVYGPLLPIESLLERMEILGTDAFGLVCNPHKKHPHIQSWFIGLRPSIFNTEWFNHFIESIRPQSSKGAVTQLYEQGFSKLVTEHGGTWKCVYNVSGRGIYNKIKKLNRKGMPFIKKAAFNRHNGALGKQISYILNHAAPDAKAAILSGAKDTFGEEYINWLLTKNPIKIIFRNIKYFTKKIFTEGL